MVKKTKKLTKSKRNKSYTIEETNTKVQNILIEKLQLSFEKSCLATWKQNVTNLFYINLNTNSNICPTGRADAIFMEKHHF